MRHFRIEGKDPHGIVITYWQEQKDCRPEETFRRELIEKQMASGWTIQKIVRVNEYEYQEEQQ